jgi:hypothetical protein
MTTHERTSSSHKQDDPSMPDRPDRGKEDTLPGEFPAVIKAFFAFDGLRDVDSLVGLFTDDATAVDEGVARHGTAEIRAWQTGAASEYTYTKGILGGEALASDRYVVTCRLKGNFPGGIADLAYDFTVVGDRISRLVIAPPVS